MFDLFCIVAQTFILVFLILLIVNILMMRKASKPKEKEIPFTVKEMKAMVRDEMRKRQEEFVKNAHNEELLSLYAMDEKEFRKMFDN